MRPGPIRLQACGPSAGPIDAHAALRSSATFACVAGCSHMRWFIAGAIAIGAVGGQAQRADEVVGEAVRELGQRVGGGRREHDDVGPAREFDVAHRRFGGGCPTAMCAPAAGQAWKVCAPTKRCAFSVIATCTVAPASRRRRTRSAAL
jgi:hypothetical protein